MKLELTERQREWFDILAKCYEELSQLRAEASAEDELDWTDDDELDWMDDEERAAYEAVCKEFDDRRSDVDDPPEGSNEDTPDYAWTRDDFQQVWKLLEAMRAVVLESDASVLARVLARGAPIPIRRLVYQIVLEAPWRDSKPNGGRRRRIARVVRDAIGDHYTYQTIFKGRPREVVLDEIGYMYSDSNGGEPISRATIERVLAERRKFGRLMEAAYEEHLAEQARVLASTLTTAGVARAQKHRKPRGS